MRGFSYCTSCISIHWCHLSSIDMVNVINIINVQDPPAVTPQKIYQWDPKCLVVDQYRSDNFWRLDIVPGHPLGTCSYKRGCTSLNIRRFCDHTQGRWSTRQSHDRIVSEPSCCETRVLQWQNGIPSHVLSWILLGGCSSHKDLYQILIIRASH